MRAALVLVLALLAMAGLLLVRGRGDSTERAPSPVAQPGSAPAPAAVPLAPATRDDAVGVPAAGRVFDEDWRPVAGAIAECDLSRATTDGEGRFALPAGTRTAKVRAKGYVPAKVNWSSASETVEVLLARGGTLVGTVRDASGRPVPGAGVRVGEVEAISDARGSYALADLPRGFLDAMAAHAPGRVWQVLARLPEAPLRPGETTEFDPVVEAGVTVEGTAPSGATVLLDKDPTRADARGRFRFDGVLPGRYGIRLDPGPPRTIHVGPGGLSGIILEDAARATLRVKGADREASLWIAGNSWRAEPGPDGSLVFEDVLAAPQASLVVGATRHDPIALPAGEMTEFEIPPPDLVFAGVVEGPDGRALAGAEVMALDEAGELRRWRKRHAPTSDSDRSGRFRVEVRSTGRSFALVASHRGFAPAVVRRLDASSDALALRLGHGAAIEGTVRYDDGEPAARAWVMAHDEDPRYEWSSHRDDPIVGDLLDAAPWRESRGARADDRGRFRIDGLAPGTYWVDGETVEAGGAPIDLVRTRDGGASVAGIVVDPRGARVPWAIIRAGEFSARTDQAGRFRIDGIPKTAYDLAVTPEKGPFASGGHFAPTTLHGVVAPRDDVVIRVGDGRTLKGRILDADSAPVAGASVKVLPPPPAEEDRLAGRPNTPGATTDADGWFELRGLPPDPLEIVAFADGHLPVVFDAGDADAGSRRLRRGEKIEGVLLDAGGAPAPGRTLHFSLKTPANPADVAPWRRDWQAYGPWFDARTGGDGRFRVTGLPAGGYEIELGTGHEMAPVRVTSGTTGLELRLLPLHRITGVVVDEHGRGVCRSGGRRLKISAHHASGQVGYIPLAEDGSFRFDRVPQGRVRLHVIGWDDFESKELEVEAGAEDVRVQLSPSRFRGR